MKKCFIEKFNSAMLHLTGLTGTLFSEQLNAQITTIIKRGVEEKNFWETEIRKIGQYSRDEAIRELIKAKKICEKIAQIDSYIKGLQI